MLNGKTAAGRLNETKHYHQYIARKFLVIAVLVLLLAVTVIFAINAGSADLNPFQVIEALLGYGDSFSYVVIWQIRLPRVLAAVVAGAGLAVAGCVMQNNLRNPLASPSTLGISNAAAFGANIAIIVLGAGTVHSSAMGAIMINNPYVVTICAFICGMLANLTILFLAKFKGFRAEAMILVGVALSSLFAAGTILIQYFAEDVQVAAAVFWTFGDLGRISWNEIIILTVLTLAAFIYFMFRRWDYNALDSGEETAKGLGVHVERIRWEGMFFASLITAVAVSFLGVIGFIGLVGPHIMRRIIGGDHRYLIPGSALMGALLLVISDTLARTMISPLVLPVGAITAFFGAPMFLYLLARGYQRT